MCDLLDEGMDFAMFHGNSKLLHHFSKAMDELRDMQKNKKTTQKTIGQFYVSSVIDN